MNLRRACHKIGPCLAKGRTAILFQTFCAGALFVFSGCSSVDFLKSTPTVLVKVPIAEPLPTGQAGHWHFYHVLEAPKDDQRRGQWYMAWNDKRPVTTRRFTPYWQTLYSRAPGIAEAVHEAFHAYPILIEPNQTFTSVAAKTPPEPQPGQKVDSRYGAGVRLVINEKNLPSRSWSDDRKPDPAHPGQFVIDPLWHLDQQHSQLANARQRLENDGQKPGDGIIIGHLDNGLDGRHAAAPLHLVRNDWRANAADLVRYAQLPGNGPARPRGKRPAAPELTGGTHGMGTVGLLAGGWVAIDEKAVPGGRIKSYYGWLGGAPFATVVPMRVAPWVVSISTAELAYAIDYASRVKHCDVITMSHGGAPTQAWADAVNAAYERGTAMFAAESDFISVVAEPFQPHGLILPASPVYPAGFRRVIGVTGVTADYHSYARNTLPNLLRAPQKLKEWAFRGSYGADGTSTVLYRPNRVPDPSQTRWLGELRPYPIAAYSPNVPWLSIREQDGARYADGVDLNGAGTSAATPQVAAAAALWLQKHRREFPDTVWRGKKDGWKKAEAAYFALLKTADRQGKPGPDKYLGAGTLKAADALKLSYAEIKKQRRPPGVGEDDPAHPGTPLPVPPGSLYYEKAPADYFDGGRSLPGLIGLQTWHHVSQNDRAKLRQQPAPHESREMALQRLYYNMALLRRWHGGDIPRRSEEGSYWQQAGREAAATARSAPSE